MKQKPGLAVLHMSHQHNTHSYLISHYHIHIPCIYLEIPCKQYRTISKKEVEKYGLGTKILICTDLYLYRYMHRYILIYRYLIINSGFRQTQLENLKNLEIWELASTSEGYHQSGKIWKT